MKLFVGMDVSLSASAVCVLSEHGKVVEEVKVASEPAALVGSGSALADVDQGERCPDHLFAATKLRLKSKSITVRI